MSTKLRLYPLLGMVFLASFSVAGQDTNENISTETVQVIEIVKNQTIIDEVVVQIEYAGSEFESAEVQINNMFKDFSLSKTEGVSEKDMKCLALNIYHEARGEPEEGKVAVGLVTLNRANHEDFPKSICGVVWEKSQFSWTAGKNKQNPTTPNSSNEEWKNSVEIAKRIVAKSNKGHLHDFTEGATYFHNKSVKPGWSKRFKRTATIGNHIFYKPVA